jgi:hypothetical protein
MQYWIDYDKWWFDWKFGKIGVGGEISPKSGFEIRYYDYTKRFVIGWKIYFWVDFPRP